MAWQRVHNNNIRITDLILEWCPLVMVDDGRAFRPLGGYFA